MKNWPVVALIITCVVILGLTSYPLLKNKYDDYLTRRTIYDKSNTQTKYPGSGEVFAQFNEKILVRPKGLGKVFFSDISKVSEYSEDQYTVQTIPSQNQLLYDVSYFQKWEDIEGSLDKYIVVKDPNSKELRKYRISFEKSDLFGENTTRLGIELIAPKIQGKTNEIIILNESNLSNLGFESAKKIFKQGEIVIIVPLFEPPILSKTDPGNVLLASWIVLRGNRSIQ